MSSLPYIIGNIAMSLDGKIAPCDRSRLNISCQEDFALRDQIRTYVDGVLIGGQTLLSDQPSLRLKQAELIRQRTARGLSPQPAGLAVCGVRSPSADNPFFHVPDSKRLIAAGRQFSGEYPDCTVYRSEKDRPDMKEAMQFFASCGIRTILAEGGGTLLFRLLEAELMHEFYLSIHPIVIGGAAAPTPFDGEGFSADRIRSVRIVSRSALSDGGMTYHCIIGAAAPGTTYQNHIFELNSEE